MTFEQTVSQLRADANLKTQLADALERAHQEGYEAGFKAAEKTYDGKWFNAQTLDAAANDAYDNGYKDGVFDAVHTPDFARSVVEEIEADQAQAAAEEAYEAAFNEEPVIHAHDEGSMCPTRVVDLRDEAAYECAMEGFGVPVVSLSRDDIIAMFPDGDDSSEENYDELDY